jgi:glycosyltransferase involved in cell wall biosynthesis
LRLLVATPFLPHPSAGHGGGVYLAALLRGLAARSEVELVSICRPHEMPLVRDLTWFARVDAVPVGQPAERSAAGRTTDLLHHAWSWGVQGRPLLAAKMWRAAARQALRRAIDRRPDAVLFEFSVMAQYLVLARGRLPTVLTDHECGSHAASGILGRSLGRARDLRLWRKYVDRFYRLADRVQAVNPDDARELGRMLGRDVAVRPLLVDLPARPADVATTPQRAVFLGDYAHHPNTEAAIYLASEVWPRIRARAPQAELWLAGARAPATVSQLQQVPGVRYVGFVRDLVALFEQARLLLAPVLSGEGSRVKVVTAAAHGVPIVANARALSGLGLPAPAARAGESAEDLAVLASAWLHDARAAAQAGSAARAWAEANLVPDAIVDMQLESLRALRHG